LVLFGNEKEQAKKVDTSFKALICKNISYPESSHTAHIIPGSIMKHTKAQTGYTPASSASKSLAEEAGVRE